MNYPWSHLEISSSHIRGEGSLILEDQETIAKAERHINSIMIAAILSLKNVDVLIEAFAQLNAHHLTLLSWVTVRARPT